MIGSIIGDIVGSVYESANIKTKEFTFFHPFGEYTDDSVMTMATADWILHGGQAADYYGKWGNRFPSAGYGGNFIDWLWTMRMMGVARPYNSCGNGSAMRIGPVGWAFATEEETLTAAKASAECTHNHPEGIKGAQAIALCIFLARHGASKEEIRTRIEAGFGYDLHFTCDEIREEYGWYSKFGDGVLCQASVPQAIVAFLDGNDFEDCIRNAISIGGDSDTLGCITGSIAEAFYDIPDTIRQEAMQYIPDDFKYIITAFEEKYNFKSNL